MDDLTLLLIGLSAAATSLLSAVAGLGGGMVLLVILLQVLDPADAIPVHGAIQIASNASRAWWMRSHIAWGVVRRHALLLVPGGLVGLQIAEALPRRVGRALIGGFALIATWLPGLLKPRVGGSFPIRGFYGVGAVHGLLNMPLGATGPMIAPFFKAAFESRQDVVGTFAASQVIGHLVKIGLFGLAGFVFTEHLGLIGVGAIGVTVGSWVGTGLLGRLSDRAFAVLFRVTVTLAALRLLLVA